MIAVPPPLQVAIYVERSHSLWRSPDALDFLKRGAERAANVADGRAAAATASAGAGGGGGGLSAEDWQCVQRESFPPSQVRAWCGGWGVT